MGARGVTQERLTVKATLDAIFRFLRPVPSAHRLIRVGGRRDGAYLLPDDLSGVAHCFSPGVDNRKNFEDELSVSIGIHCHMADFSSSAESFRTELIEGRQTFLKKWLGPVSHGDDISLDDWVGTVDISSGEDLMMQMDIEGGEYSVIPSISDELLRQFRIIILELHDLHRLQEPEWARESVLPLVQKLAPHFDVVHAHPNNCCEIVSVSPGHPTVPRILEVTMLRKDRNVAKPTQALNPPLLPHPLDILWNVPGRSPKHLEASWLNGRRPSQSVFRIVQDHLRFQLSWRWRRRLPLRFHVVARDVKGLFVAPFFRIRRFLFSDPTIRK